MHDVRWSWCCGHGGCRQPKLATWAGASLVPAGAWRSLCAPVGLLHLSRSHLGLGSRWPGS